MKACYPYRKALVTGAGRGIGASVCRELAKRSVKLVAMNRSRQVLMDLVDELGPDQEISPYFADVTHFEELEKELHKILEQHPDIDLVVLNAGLDMPQRIENFDWRVAKDQIDTNLTANYVFMSVLVPHLLSQGHGRIAVVSSIGSFVGCPYEHVYNASKAGARMMTDGLRAELQTTPVGITGIYPGFIGTDMIKGNAFNMSDIMPVEEAALVIVDGISEQREEILFPEETAALAMHVMSASVEERMQAVRALAKEDWKNL